MKKFFIAAALAAFPFMTSASGAYAAEHGHGHHEHGAAAESGLSLNQGERWEMDQHTRAMLLKMEEAFFVADHSTQAGLNAAGAELKGQLGELISGCTMQGAAHDQLHLFLTDYMPAIDRLAEAADYESARAAAIELKGHFETYKHYFR